MTPEPSIDTLVPILTAPIAETFAVGRYAEPMVPEATLLALSEVRVLPEPTKLAAVTVPAEKFPLASRATMVEAVFALVALLVTVNVAPVLWFAVNVWEPERPVPETARVSVASFTVGS
jgi:hypothetical protein